MIALGAACGKGSNSCANDGRAIASLLVLGASGIYTLGCQAIKGVACVADGYVGVSGSYPSREGAEYFAARYNAALAASLHSRYAHASQ